MKKVCYFSLIIGIGMGMIITASINEFVQGSELQLPQSAENQLREGIEKTLGEMKNDLYLSKENQEPIEEATEQEAQADEDELNPEETDTISNVESASSIEVIITSGMNTKAIANLMAEKGLVEKADDFIEKAYEYEVTRKFIAGKARIPENSTIEEILKILTSRNR